MRDRISSFDAIPILDKSIIETEKVLLDLIRFQILEGENADGSNLPVYSRESYDNGYIDFKLDSGKFPINTLPHYNLHLTGDFLESMGIKIENKFYSIDSVGRALDDGLKQLMDKENKGGMDAVYGLSSKSMEEYKKTLFPVFMKHAKAHFDFN